MVAEDLPLTYLSLFVKRVEETCGMERRNHVLASITDRNRRTSIRNLLSWEETPEGRAFWCDIHEAQNVYELPSIQENKNPNMVD